METCSPTKRRALAPLDSNALASPKTLFKDGSKGPLGSPMKRAGDVRKRMFEVDGAASPVGKKACLGRDDEVRLKAPFRDAWGMECSPYHGTPRNHVRSRAVETDLALQDASSRSHSPEASSLFDTSANDASWATATTEPDAAAPLAAAALRQIPFTRPRALTREQAKEKAEILRLRLSLGLYKVRTGQTTVPLADLQRRPMPRPTPRVVVQSPEPSSDATQPDPQQQAELEQDQEQDDHQPPSDDEDASNSDSRIPDTPPHVGTAVPRLAVMRTGVTSGLLSLARSESS
ncbi:hypothetical protein AK830_g3945 [Neonectria ditissima]|uniref:Uncharacterized protein n=1 Tax=Neonectria ditissima TaxID=78410 RepID=A0A0P7B7S4_9HYPO|nr:hypothetical protein AK830_g3945 [Neonectria ditissima]